MEGGDAHVIRASLEDAYEEACRALGEAIVRERLLVKHLEQQSPEPASSPEEAPGQY